MIPNVLPINTIYNMSLQHNLYNDKETLLALLRFHDTPFHNVVLACKTNTFWRSRRVQFQYLVYISVPSSGINCITDCKED